MRILCTICMRGGSKGLKNKNILPLKGKPLLWHTIKHAKDTKIFDQIVVSTDSAKISELSKSFGASSWFIRPKNLSSDKSAKLPAIRHALVKSEKYFHTTFDIIVDLDATSPLRSIEDIKKSLKLFIKEKSNNLITASSSRKNPYFNVIEKKRNLFGVVKDNKNYDRRQDAPKTYDMNASIYIWKRQFLLKSDKFFTNKTSLYLMPFSRSIDIDSKEDYELVKYFINKKK